jgi:eukaryotic-like serine/threonine-protein kinase
VLSGRAKPATMPKLSPKATPTAAARNTPRAPLVAKALVLQAPDGKSLRLSVRTELGKALMRQFGPDAEFWDNRQCVIERAVDGRWTLVPTGPTTNETLVNGRALTRASILSPGDRIAVGREAKGVAKLPLTVRAG